MVIWKPPLADGLGWAVGMEWPEGNEDLMWELADDWRAAASSLDGIGRDIDDAIAAIRAAYPEGAGGEQMIRQLQAMRTGEGSVEELVKWFNGVAETADATGNEFEYTKLMFYATLVMLAAEIALVWLFPPTAPAEEALLIAGTRVGVRMLVRRLLTRLSEQGLKHALMAALKSPFAKRLLIHLAIDAGMNAAPDLAIQDYQSVFGRRDGVDWGQVALSGATGAVGGLVGAGAGRAALGPLAKVFGNKTFGDRLVADRLAGMVGGGANALGAYATQGALTGDWHFDPRMLTAGTLPGALHGAGHGLGPGMRDQPNLAAPHPEHTAPSSNPAHTAPTPDGSAPLHTTGSDSGGHSTAGAVSRGVSDVHPAGSEHGGGPDTTEHAASGRGGLPEHGGGRVDSGQAGVDRPFVPPATHAAGGGHPVGSEPAAARNDSHAPASPDRSTPTSTARPVDTGTPHSSARPPETASPTGGPGSDPRTPTHSARGDTPTAGRAGDPAGPARAGNPTVPPRAGDVAAPGRAGDGVGPAKTGDATVPPRTGDGTPPGSAGDGTPTGRAGDATESARPGAGVPPQHSEVGGASRPGVSAMPARSGEGAGSPSHPAVGDTTPPVHAHGTGVEPTPHARRAEPAHGAADPRSARHETSHDEHSPHHDRPDPHETGPLQPRPSIEEAHARHGERTPAGVSHHRGDTSMGDLPHRVPRAARHFSADVHISEDGHAVIGGHKYTPEEYGHLLRNAGWDGKSPIRLIGCDAATNGFAARLATHLGTDVLAPTKSAWTDNHGRVYSSTPEPGPDGNRRPRIPPDGEWETHHPDGTKTKAGEDGFAPGTEAADKHGLDPNEAEERQQPGKQPRRIDPADSRLMEPLSEQEVGKRRVIVDGNGVPHRIDGAGDSTAAIHARDFLNEELRRSGNLYNENTGNGSKVFFQDDNSAIVPKAYIGQTGEITGTTADLVKVTWKNGRIDSVETFDATTSSQVDVKAESAATTLRNKLPGGSKYQSHGAIFVAPTEAWARAVAAETASEPRIRVIHLPSGFDSASTP
ncbi:hypothetical protein [Nocardia blacklockiae]|uniref:WXG100-like domain-containing protein n=1 Tax=Nocardia blacklockiae TaxID=480036 RepID=UPI0018941FD2|nr:hypothetical protein [Nocardia blacklockiae]MBF6171452.1 hypothetical protein [Nocardia blacklockiae]